MANCIEVENYGHPGSHPATMITPDATHRFVTDEMIAAWNDHTHYILMNQLATIIGLTVNPDGNIQLLNGTDVNEFSNDNTLGGDESTTVPTEQAVKGYVDTIIAARVAATDAETVIRENAEQSIITNYIAADAVITAAYIAADGVIEAAYLAADAVIVAQFVALHADYAVSSELADVINGAGASLIGIEDAAGILAALTVEDALAEIKVAVDAQPVILASVVNAEGASLVGIEDPSGLLAAVTVEDALLEIAAEVDTNTANITAQLPVVAAAAALNAVADAINTTGKFLGKFVIDDTSGVMAYAAGPLAADLWKNVGTGATAYTPV